MSSEPSPFIPAALDDADLTPHEFRVFCHVARRGECLASIGKMSDDTGVSEPTLRKALKTLRSASMVEREKRPGTTNKHRTVPPDRWDLSVLKEDEDMDPSQDFGGRPSQDIRDPKKLPLQNLGGHPLKKLGGHPSQDFGVPSKGNPFEGNPFEGAKHVSAAEAPLPSAWREVIDRISWQAQSLPDDHPARWEYPSGDWRWVAAEWSLRHMADADMLNSHYRKRLESERPGKIASEWADELRKIVELDGYCRDDVRISLAWLFGTENWWKDNRTIQGLGSLRKTDDEGTTKFDKILQSALADYEQQQQQTTDVEEIQQGFELDEERQEDAAGSSGDSIPHEQDVGIKDFTW